MERNLGRFTHRSDEDEQSDRGRAAHLKAAKQCQLRLVRHSPFEQRCELDGSIQVIGQHDSGEERNVPGPQHDEGSKGGLCCWSMGIVVRKQGQKPAQQLPRDKEGHEIGARDHEEQRRNGERQHSLIPGLPLVLLQVTGRVAIEQSPDSRDDHHHDGSQTIDGQFHHRQDLPWPRKQSNAKGICALGHLPESCEGSYEAGNHHPPARRVATVAHIPARKRSEGRRDERGQGDQQWIVVRQNCDQNRVTSLAFKT